MKQRRSILGGANSACDLVVDKSKPMKRILIVISDDAGPEVTVIGVPRPARNNCPLITVKGVEGLWQVLTEIPQRGHERVRKIQNDVNAGGRCQHSRASRA